MAVVGGEKALFAVDAEDETAVRRVKPGEVSGTGNENENL